MITLREITMLNIMNSITDKPDWDKKVSLNFDHVVYLLGDPIVWIRSELICE
jgi:hypothetical protein